MKRLLLERNILDQDKIKIIGCMNRIEKWISNKKIPKPKDWNFELHGTLIENIIPPHFEAYLLIYHPYSVPIGELINETESESIYLDSFITKLNQRLSKSFGIPISDLPTKKYDIGKTIKSILINRSDFNQAVFDKKIKELETEGLKLALQAFQDVIDGKVKPIPQRKVSWAELYKYYNIEFNDYVNWVTLSKMVKPEDRIEDQEMPVMDFIPKSLIKIIRKKLEAKGIKRVNVNSCNNLGHVINETSMDVPIFSLITYINLNLIAPSNLEWIIYTPWDFCRSIVGGSKKFVLDFKQNTKLETSNILNSKHRL